MSAAPWLDLFWRGVRWALSALFSFLLWTFWLALAAIFVIQVRIATANQLAVPDFLLRAFEKRLAISGIHAEFGDTSFDPTGRVLIENIRLSLPGFNEPVVKIGSAYARFDPWALVIGNFEPRELQLSGVTWLIPSMLSPSGQPLEIVRDLQTSLVPSKNLLEIRQLDASVSGIVVTAHGLITLPPAKKTSGAAPLPAADLLAKNYPALCRQLLAITDRIGDFDQPSIQLDFSPSENRLALVDLLVLARGLQIDESTLKLAPGTGGLRLTDLRLATRFPLLGTDAVRWRLDLSAGEVALPFAASARGLHTVLRGALQPGHFVFEPHDLDLTIDALDAAGFSAKAVAMRLTPGPLPALKADVLLDFMGEPLTVAADADFNAQTATIRFDGGLSPAALGPLGDLLHTNVRHFFDFEGLECQDGLVHLGPRWQFDNLFVHTVLTRINADRVIMDEGKATIEFDGHTVHAPEAWARIGESWARGTYDQDVATRDYRFLLDGRLRPPAIAAWWPSGWWSSFWDQFEFRASAPEASVDVQSRWRGHGESATFVFADLDSPVIRGAPFDHARTRLFLRPGFNDGLEVFATAGTGTVRGTFLYTTEAETGSWRTLTIQADTSVDPKLAVQIIGPGAAEVMEPFAWTDLPQIKLTARIDGSAAPGGKHDEYHIEARTEHEFRLYDFPLERVAFTADVNDDDITVERMEAGFAGGVVTGRSKIFGRGDDRHIGFDAVLKNASLGQVATQLQAFSARRKKQPPTAPGKFVQERANVQLDVAISGEGKFVDPYSYTGGGNASLTGAALGEVPLLGALSQVFTFTSLRFNTVQANFKLEGPKINFTKVELRGANSAVDATGEYALDPQTLDFKAKIYPFQESNSILKTVVGTVLSPISNVFEVKLTGTLDKPEWGVVLTPTKIFDGTHPDQDKDKTPAPANGSAPKPETPPASSAAAASAPTTTVPTPPPPSPAPQAPGSPK